LKILGSIAKISILPVLAGLTLYILLSPLPDVKRSDNRQTGDVAAEKAPSSEAGGMFEGVKRMETYDSVVTGYQGTHRLWEMTAGTLKADNQDVSMRETKTVLFRHNLPQLILTAPRVAYRPNAGDWQAFEGVNGQSGNGLKLEVGRLNYIGKRELLQGDKGVSVSGRGWKLNGDKMEADAGFEDISIRGKVRLEFPE